MNVLNELMIKYGTDKQAAMLNYVEFYEKYFQKLETNKLKILEIGIYRPSPSQMLNPPMTNSTHYGPGASLKVWRDFFKNSNIYAADIDDFKDIDDEKIITIQINQERREDLQRLIDNFGSNFDIIIDDGGHSMKQQQITFAYLFKALKPGGCFVIEDLVTSYDPMYISNCNNTNTKYTTLTMLTEFLKHNTILSDFMSENEKQYLNANIKNIFVENGNGSEIAFIFKK